MWIKTLLPITRSEVSHIKQVSQIISNKKQRGRLTSDCVKGCSDLSPHTVQYIEKSRWSTSAIFNHQSHWCATNGLQVCHGNLGSFLVEPLWDFSRAIGSKVCLVNCQKNRWRLYHFSALPVCSEMKKDENHCSTYYMSEMLWKIEYLGQVLHLSKQYFQALITVMKGKI